MSPGVLMFLDSVDFWYCYSCRFVVTILCVVVFFLSPDSECRVGHVAFCLLALSFFCLLPNLRVSLSPLIVASGVTKGTGHQPCPAILVFVAPDWEGKEVNQLLLLLFPFLLSLFQFCFLDPVLAFFPFS
ncbi:unnamed protein product [Alopecurus aequalis]